MKNIFTPFIRIFALILFIWKFKVVLWYLVVELDSVIENCNMFSKAYANGVEGVNSAKTALLNLLSLRTVQKFVLTTDTDNDNNSLQKTISLINNKVVFPIAWRIMLGDWNFNIKQSRWSSFADKIKSVLPFVDKTKAVKALAVNKDGTELTEAEENNVVELVKLLCFSCTIAPKIKSLKV